MKKKIFVGLALALMLMLTTALPALAYGGGEADVEVELTIDEVEQDDSLFVGNAVILTGTATVTASAECEGLFIAAAGAEGEVVIDVNGEEIGSATESDFDIDLGFFTDAEAGISIEYPWEIYYSIDNEGTHTLTQSAFADAWWATFWYPSSGEASAFESVSTSFEVANSEYDPLGEYGGQFLVCMFDDRYHEGYAWEGGWNADEQILGEPVDITGQDNGNTCRLEIPEGTEITLPNGFDASYLILNSVNGVADFSPSAIDFSQTVTLSKLVDDEWVEVESFTSIRNGKA